MANNLIYFDTTNNSIQQFNANDVAKIADYILEYMAANGTFTGSITIGTSNPLGTFTDTTLGGYPYPAANSDNVTVFSTTYTLSQVNTATLSAAADPPKYIGLDTTTTPGQVVLQENKTTLENLADEIVDRMIGDYGVNSYYLGTAAPSDGGLWTNLGSLVDTIDPSNPNTTYFLWKKLNSGTYTTDFKRPLKLSSGEVLQFSNTEIQQIVKTVEQRVVATGKGLYSLSSSAPPTGTWTAVGSSVDIRRTTQEIDFTGPDFSGTFTTDFDSSTFTSNFDGANFFGLVPVDYTSTTDTGNFQTTYAGEDSVPFVGFTPTPFLGFVPNPDVNPYLAEDATNFANVDGQNFNVAVPYTSTFTNNATPFVGDGPFNADATFTGDGGPAFQNTNLTPFVNTNQNPFTNVNAINYVGPLGTYAGPGPTYLGPGPTYLGPGGPLYTGTASYVGIISYLGPTTYLGTASFDGLNYTKILSYAGPRNYLGPATYLGPGAIVTYFYGPGPITYLGPGGFAGVYYGPIDGPIYTGSVPASYTETYIGDYILSYTGDYTGLYTADYTGTRVSSTTTTISTVYLWRRIA